MRSLAAADRAAGTLQRALSAGLPSQQALGQHVLVQIRKPRGTQVVRDDRVEGEQPILRRWVDLVQVLVVSKVNIIPAAAAPSSEQTADFELWGCGTETCTTGAAEQTQSHVFRISEVPCDQDQRDAMSSGSASRASHSLCGENTNGAHSSKPASRGQG